MQTGTQNESELNRLYMKKSGLWKGVRTPTIN